VAIKVLEIYQRDNIIAKAAVTGEYLQRRLAAFTDHPLVGEVRGSGLIAAIELVANKATGEAFAGGAVGAYAQKAVQDRGVILRTVAGSSLAFCPPLIITTEHIDEIIDATSQALDQTLEYCRKEQLLVD
jgi:4-aminobutyrate--pyruvate transaminase